MQWNSAVQETDMREEEKGRRRRKRKRKRRRKRRDIYCSVNDD